MYKYPRTRHIEGSRAQHGDLDDHVPFEALKGLNLVVEEKMDGSNCGISFEEGVLRLQSRGHYLNGGDYPHFNLFKQWAACLGPKLWTVLGEDYVMYGEWLFAKHCLFYDRLPHFFMEFDILEKKSGRFLDTPRRQGMLAGLPVVSVRVMAQGPIGALKDLAGLVGPSAFSTLETMEGLYVKHEEAGEVKGRYKFVRDGFIQKVVDMGDHWINMPLEPNRLAPNADLWRSI